MLKIYNSLSRKKEYFKPLKGGNVNMFVCGPTVYDLSHLGHARTYIIFDVIVRFLKYLNYNVYYLQNITDIDDKIIKRAKERKVSWKELSRKYEKEYLKDMKKLKIENVNKYARATDHIKEIINQVERLIEKGFAYQIEDGVYYDILKFKNYGKLSKRKVSQAEDAISRIDESKKKRNKGDFCLWKKSKEQESKWQSPWGYGRPGWHIEDTAITEKFFGSNYDIHGGAKDLIFPHHEAEIAQMEALSEKSPLVKYWVHSGFLTVRGKKMSKSLGNFITIKDFLKDYSPRILRFLVIKNHYNSSLDYNKKLILQVKKELNKIDEFIEKLKKETSKDKNTKNKKELKKLISNSRKLFLGAMNDDFNTPKVLAMLFKFINQTNSLLNKEKVNKEDTISILKFLKEIDEILNFIFWKEQKKEIPKNILELIKERESSRKEKKWKKADEIRDEIKKLGYIIKDKKKGISISEVNN